MNAAYPITVIHRTSRKLAFPPGYSQGVCPVSGQTPWEEAVNSLTHGIGLLLSLGGITVLLFLAAEYGDWQRLGSCAIYGTTLAMTYTASTLYHGSRSLRRKRAWRNLDQASIYLLIAGTYTPFTLVSLQGSWGWGLFSAIWGASILGVGMKLLFAGRFEGISMPAYLAMGWMCLVAVVPLTQNVPPGGLVWLALGGMAYSMGALFVRWSRVPFNHGVWHLAALAGSICHYLAIAFYVLPPV